MNLPSLAARNLLRNKVRSALTVMGVATAIVTFLLLRTIVGAWTAASDYANKDRVVTRHKVTFVMPLPFRYAEDLRQHPDIQASTFANWFDGRDPLHETEFFATLAVDAATYFDVLQEVAVPADQLAAFREDRTGAIVGDVLAQKLGWTIGDRVTLESGIFPSPPDSPWTFTIDGIYTATQRTADRSTFLFHWATLNDALPEGQRDEIGWIISRVRDPGRTAEIAQSVDLLFDDRDIQTLTQDEHSFNASFLAGFSAVLRALDVVSVAIMTIMMLILGNTIAMGVRERTNEYGTLRAIGFLPKHIAAFILGEAAVLSGLGGILGVAIGWPFVELGIGRWLEENMGGFFPFFRVPPLMALLAVVLAVCLGVIAAIGPARGAARLEVTEALRRVA